ncbi:proteinase-activated receptor 1-like [Chanos chanos]|uniref:Proteinase-activated receptor 1 n=1 Tax=Chanos chanos TaxID=29144 RepID=A0A6J2UZM2_CHACN|nr:proteinase-activated receptor 1 [Chanos chanos]
MDATGFALLMIGVHTAAAFNGSLPRGRAFAVYTRTEVVTDEPIDYPYSDNISQTTQGFRNRSRQIEINYVKDKAAAFLTGSLSTQIIPSIYCLVFIISLLLNSFAVAMFSCRIKTKKPAVIFMLNLAFADLLFTLLLPLKIHYHLSGNDWLFGQALCQVVTVAFYCYMYCTILLIMCISVDRMLAVAYPFSSVSWRNAHNAGLVCTGMWVLALLGTVPMFSMNQTMYLSDLNITTCHDVQNPSGGAYVYHFSVLLCLFFFVPLVVTATCYARFIWVLGVKSAKHGNGVALSSTIYWKKRRRAVMMSIAVAIEFVACFVPTNIILLVHCVGLGLGDEPEEGGVDALYATYLVSLCLGSVSTCLDPMLYYYGSSQCQKQIAELLGCKSSSGNDSFDLSSESSKSSSKGNATRTVNDSSQYKKLLA